VETYISQVLGLIKMKPDLSKIPYMLRKNGSLNDSHSRMGRGLSYLLRNPSVYQTSAEVAETLNKERNQGDLKIVSGFLKADFEELRKGGFLDMKSNIGPDRTDEPRVAYRPSELCMKLVYPTV
jgi:hypothetical protein